MDVKRIEGSPIPGAAPPRPQEAAPKAPRGKAAPVADSVEISEADSAGGAGRAAKVEAARRKLASGELAKPEAYEKAAGNLLRSGALKKGK